MIQTRPMTAADWPAVEIILAAGIAGGEATFETTTPSWERFDAGKVTDAHGRRMGRRVTHIGKRGLPGCD